MRSSGLAKISSWQVNIQGMLRSIPTVSTEVLAAFFDAIDSKLLVYENLLYEAPVLFPEHFGSNKDIILDILSFL